MYHYKRLYYEMKRFWLFFCVLWGLSWLFPVNAIEFEVNGWTYEVLSEEKRTVSIIRGAYWEDEIPSVVTWEDVSYTVVAIGDEAFMYYNIDPYVWKIPETITEIGDKAFYGTWNTNIWLPESIAVIGFNAGLRIAFTSAAVNGTLIQSGDDCRSEFLCPYCPSGRN